MPIWIPVDKEKKIREEQQRSYVDTQTSLICAYRLYSSLRTVDEWSKVHAMHPSSQWYSCEYVCTYNIPQMLYFKQQHQHQHQYQQHTLLNPIAAEGKTSSNNNNNEQTDARIFSHTRPSSHNHYPHRQHRCLWVTFTVSQHCKWLFWYKQWWWVNCDKAVCLLHEMSILVAALRVGCCWWVENHWTT